MLVSREVLVSVDIEASGPSPSTGSMISLGACLVEDPSIGVYLELKPIPNAPWSEEAAATHGLNREALERDGLDPADAMARLETWLREQCGPHTKPVFVGFNAPFDWMFVADYFWRFLARNPFGISALDLKSYFMARAAVERWDHTTRSQVDSWLGAAPDHTHHALDDARGQAHVARSLLGMDSGLDKSRRGVEI
jgi:DNA polymerase III epsilon subunit-like protein